MKQQFIYIDDKSLTKEGYIGYANITNGKLFKQQNRQDEQLTPTKHPKMIGLISQFYNDSTIDEIKQLPYQLSDILIQPNEVVHAHVINDTFRKLYTNVEYILSRCYYLKNNIPTNYKGWFGCALYMDYGSPLSPITYRSDINYSMHFPSKPAYQHIPCQFAGLSGIEYESQLSFGKFDDGGKVYINKYDRRGGRVNTIPPETKTGAISAYKSEYTKYDSAITALHITTKHNNQYTLIVTPTQIFFTQFKQNPETLKWEVIDKGDDKGDDKIDTIQPLSGYNNVAFKNIVSAALDDEGYLYIADDGNSVIVQYDLRYLINDDPIFKYVFCGVIGGKDSDNIQKFKWGSLNFIQCSDKYVFVYNEMEHNILVFDKYLNFIRYIGNTGFLYHKPRGITYRTLQHEFHIICEDGTVYVFDDNFQVTASYKLDITNCLDIEASTCDSNVYYVTTTDSVYQKLFSNNKTVGVFDLISLEVINTKYLWWSKVDEPWINCSTLWGGDYDLPQFTQNFKVNTTTIKHVDGMDEIWLFANHGRILWLQNKIEYSSLLASPNILNYDLSNLKCSETDYVQSFTYNRIIAKFLDILQSIANTLAYKPSYAYNDYKYLEYTHLNYNTNVIDINSMLDDLKIHDNDLLTIDIINRVLHKLYSIEQSLIDNMQLTVTNKKYDLTESFILEE